MKKLISFLLILSLITQAFSQTLVRDTLSAKQYLIKADRLKKESKFDSSSVYLKKAETIYSRYNLNEAFLECELKRGELFIIKRELNKALQILSAGQQKALNLFGEKSALYADYCSKIGLAYVYAGKFAEAKKIWIKALVIRRNLYGNKHLKVSDSYNNLAGLYARTEDYYKSLKLYQKALKIREELLPEDDLRIAYSYQNLGNAYLKIENPDLALHCYLNSSAIKKKQLIPLSPNLASLYDKIGFVYYQLKEYDKALTNYEKALFIRQKNLGDNHPKTAEVCTDMAIVLNAKGDYYKAKEYNEKALKISETNYGEGDRRTARILQQLGSVYLNLNDLKKAVGYFNNSLETTKKSNGTWTLETAEMYSAIGKILREKSENTAALSYFFNALKIQRDVYKSDNHPEIAESFLNIGITSQADEEYYQAIDYYNKCLDLRLKLFGNKHPKTARVYNLLASAYKAKRNYSTELKYLQKALISNIEDFSSENINTNPDLNRKTIFYYNQKELLETLNEKAEAYSNLYLRTDNIENLEASYKVYELSDLMLDRMKFSVFGKADYTYLSEKRSSIYDKAARVCMLLYKKTNENIYVQKAFAYSEKYKAGVLSETLYSVKAKKYEGIPDSVLQIENNLSADISYFRKRISEDSNDAEAKKKLFSLEREQNAFVLMTEENYPKYYELKYEPIALTTEDIQDEITDSTLVLDYFCTETSKFLYIFMIKEDGEDMRFIRKPDNFDENILNFRKRFLSNPENQMTSFSKESYRLYQKLIPDVIENDTSIKEFVIIRNGALSMIPFESLLTEEYIGDVKRFENYPWLIKKYAVSYSFSADLFCKAFYLDYYEDIDTTDANNFLALAPVFDYGNQRIISEKTRDLLEKTDNLSRKNSRTHLLNGMNISGLPESENEVRVVFEEFINRGDTAVLKLRSQADEAFVKSGELEDYQYIHITTHGFVNSEEPKLSGILLAQNTAGGNDGFLYTEEIFNLDLNAELLVLSDFETVFGQTGKGEGLSGLTRALLYAGAKNTLMSLWQIPGNSTGKLMFEFYKNALDSYDATDENEFNYALQSAKLKLIESGQYAHPFYWSSFVLTGK